MLKADLLLLILQTDYCTPLLLPVVRPLVGRVKLHPPLAAVAWGTPAMELAKGFEPPTG